MRAALNGHAGPDHQPVVALTRCPAGLQVDGHCVLASAERERNPALARAGAGVKQVVALAAIQNCEPARSSSEEPIVTRATEQLVEMDARRTAGRRPDRHG